LFCQQRTKCVKFNVMPVKAVIFDVDGVIFDSENLHVSSWEKVFGARGLFFPDTVYQSGFGVCDREFLLNLKRKGKLPAGINIEELLQEKVKTTLQLAGNSVPTFPSVVETILQLKKQYLLAAASNSDERLVHLLLQKAGIQHCFTTILARNDVTRPKPFPDIYFACAEKLKVSPQFCLVVEDSVVGVAAARAAGMFCIAVTHTTAAEKLTRANLIVDSLSPDKVCKAISILHEQETKLS